MKTRFYRESFPPNFTLNLHFKSGSKGRHDIKELNLFLNDGKDSRLQYFI